MDGIELKAKEIPNWRGDPVRYKLTKVERPYAGRHQNWKSDEMPIEGQNFCSLKQAQDLPSNIYLNIF